MKDFEGNKIAGTEFQRAAGWCEAALNLVCIAHPGVVCLICRAERVATLNAWALFEAERAAWQLN